MSRPNPSSGITDSRARRQALRAIRRRRRSTEDSESLLALSGWCTRLDSCRSQFPRILQLDAQVILWTSPGSTEATARQKCRNRGGIEAPSSCCGSRLKRSLLAGGWVDTTCRLWRATAAAPASSPGAGPRGAVTDIGNSVRCTRQQLDFLRERAQSGALADWWKGRSTGRTT